MGAYWIPLIPGEGGGTLNKVSHGKNIEHFFIPQNKLKTVVRHGPQVARMLQTFLNFLRCFFCENFVTL